MDLEKIAGLFGVEIVEADKLAPEWSGMYLHSRRLILLRPGLDYWTRRSVLAHELAHAFYRDESHGCPRIEKRADQWAAQLLISKDDYQAAETICGPHIGAIAHELGVTPEVVKTWCKIYSRIPS